MLLFFFPLLLPLVAVPGNGEPVELPDMNAKIGTEFSMRCANETVKLPVNWLYQRTSDTLAIDICVNGKITLGYERTFESDVNSSQLTILNVMLNISGIYTCVENMGFGQAYRRRLIVDELISSSTIPTSTITSSPATTPTTDSNRVTVIVLCCIIAILILIFVVAAIFVYCRFIRNENRQNYQLRDQSSLLLEEKQPVQTSADAIVQISTETERNASSGAATMDQMDLRLKQLNEHIQKIDDEIHRKRHEQSPGTSWTNNEFVVRIAGNPELFTNFVNQLVDKVKNVGSVDAIAGITSRDCRGEIFASPVALLLKLPYIPIILAGPSTEDVMQVEYTENDGTVMKLEIRKNQAMRGKIVVIIDSYLETGSSNEAAKKLVREGLQATVVKTIVYTSERPADDVESVFVHFD